MNEDHSAPWSRALVAALASALLAACAPARSPGSPEAYDHQTCVENALRNKPDPALLAEAAVELGQGCRFTDTASCSMLGVMYELGRGVPLDVRRARSLYQQSCDGGNARACGNLGALVLREPSLGAPERALELLRSACDAVDARACATLGAAHLEGGAAPASPAEARRLLELACDRGEPSGCVALALGLARSGDEARADTLLARACARGHAEGCALFDERSRRIRERREPAVIAGMRSAP